MEFQIRFNRLTEENEEEILAQLGTYKNFGRYGCYIVQINELIDLKHLQDKLNEIVGEPYKYSLIVDIEHETYGDIFFEKAI